MNEKKQKNNKTQTNNHLKNYLNVLFIPIHTNDAINSIDIFDDLILFGTIMGNVILGRVNQKKSIQEPNKSLNNTDNTINKNIDIHEVSKEIPYPKSTLLISLASENIPCLSFESFDTINISIGDLEIVKFEGIKDYNSNDPNSGFQFVKIKNYPNENQHIQFCENTFCFMSGKYFLLLRNQFAEFTPIENKEIFYINKDLKNLNVINGTIEMTNYNVPFDFDGDRFLFLDYKSKDERRICIYYTLTRIPMIVHFINKDFGHISHMKLIPDNKIFLCRNYNQCEIIEFTKDSFNIIEKFTHIGYEVIASDVYINGMKIYDEENSFDNFNKDMKENNEENNEENINQSNANKNDSNNGPVYLRLNNKTNDKYSINSKNYLYNDNTIRKLNSVPKKVIKEVNNDNDDDNIFIATLDIDGNVNVYHNKKEICLFNLYKIENIEKDYKDKTFFSSGFPYYISFNNLYYAITTDHGVFVIKKT